MTPTERDWAVEIAAELALFDSRYDSWEDHVEEIAAALRKAKRAGRAEGIEEAATKAILCLINPPSRYWEDSALQSYIASQIRAVGEGEK